MSSKEAYFVPLTKPKKLGTVCSATPSPHDERVVKGFYWIEKKIVKVHSNLQGSS